MTRPDEDKEVVTGATSTETKEEVAEEAVETETAEGTSTETVKTEKTEAEEKAVENAGAIPKWRFDEINNERKELAKDLADTKKKMADLEKAIKTAPAGTTAKKFEDPQQQAFYDVYIAPEKAEMKAELEKIKEEFKSTLQEERVLNAKVRVAQEVAKLKTKFPEMNEDEVLRDFSESENESLEEIAEKSHNDRIKYGEEYVKKYRAGKVKDLKDNPGTMPAGGLPVNGKLTPPKGLNGMALFKWYEREAIKFAAGKK